jgi:DNA polymerase I-like protein with 3'-5' exonuclease and polymerase domains
MQGGIAKQVIKWLSLRNRRSVVKSPKKATGWLHKPRLLVDNKLSPASSGLTNTRRQKHRDVANVPKSQDTVLLGKEMRELFRASPGKQFVGYDAAALEGRCEAHFTFPYDDGKYAEEILQGDIHTANAVVFGLLTQDEADEGIALGQKGSDLTEAELEVYNKGKGTRNGGGIYGGVAKSGKYCITYGGGGPKLAMTLNKPAKEGKKIVEDYWNGNIALKNLRDDMIAEWKSNKKKKRYKDQWGKAVGWVNGIDGGRIIIRNEHSIINALFQNCGAMIMDLAGLYMQKWITNKDIDAQRVIYYHDEYLWECNPEDSKVVGELGVQSIIKAGEFLNLNIALDAEYLIGQNWSECH